MIVPKKEYRKSDRDTMQIHQYEHDEVLNARRTVLVGGGQINIPIDHQKLAESFKEALKGLEINGSGGEVKVEFPEIIEIEKQVIVPQVETKIIEVPVVTKETQVVEIEKPVITEIIKTIEIDKPVITEKIVEKLPSWALFILTLQTAAIGGLIWSIFTKQWGI